MYMNLNCLKYGGFYHEQVLFKIKDYNWINNILCTYKISNNKNSDNGLTYDPRPTATKIYTNDSAACDLCNSYRVLPTQYLFKY